jgi:hypothetical protein
MIFSGTENWGPAQLFQPLVAMFKTVLRQVSSFPFQGIYTQVDVISRYRPATANGGAKTRFLPRFTAFILPF